MVICFCSPRKKIQCSFGQFGVTSYLHVDFLLKWYWQWVQLGLIWWRAPAAQPLGFQLYHTHVLMKLPSEHSLYLNTRPRLLVPRIFCWVEINMHALGPETQGHGWGGLSKGWQSFTCSNDPLLQSYKLNRPAPLQKYLARSSTLTPYQTQPYLLSFFWVSTPHSLQVRTICYLHLPPSPPNGNLNGYINVPKSYRAQGITAPMMEC